MIIPIGIQCTDAVFKREINKESLPLPFDWMISTPAFVYEMLELLLDKNIDLYTIVTTHFFRFDKKARYVGVHDTYTTYDKDEIGDDYIIYNEKYNVLFPNDRFNEKTINKYINAFQRLRDVIINLDYKDEVKFVYTTQCSPLEGSLIIDRNHVITDEVENLMKINTLVSKYRKNYKMVIFDAIGHDSNTLKDNNIILIKISPEKQWIFLIQEMAQYAYLFHFTLYKYLSAELSA